MSKIRWDGSGDRLYQTGVDHGVLYSPDGTGAFGAGVAWNGLITVTESPSGAEATPIYADNIKYLNLLSAEEFGGTIEAYMSPKEFDKCDGSASPSTGVTVGQQNRSNFGLSYRSLVGNDIQGTDYGYLLHLVYNALASPSEKAFSTVNETPEAVQLSWEFTTTPVEIPGFKPSATITIDSTKVDATALGILETILYGSEGVEARLPLPEEVFAIFEGTIQEVIPPVPVQTGNVVAIPTAAGVDYLIEGKVVTGNYTLTKQIVITARPQKGYTFPPNTDNTWQYAPE